MSFAAILFALLLEQARPLAHGNRVHSACRSWVRWCSKNFDAGRTQHAWLAWGFAVLLPTALTLAVHWLLVATLGWLAASVWSVVVLYATLGFRQFSHHFTGIRDALDAGDEALARERLAQWRHMDASDLPRSEIVRHVIEHSVLAAHWHVFGVLGWFSVLAALGFGPAGAVLYRLSEFVASYWKQDTKPHRHPVSLALQAAAVNAWGLIDWLPARVTALGFAVVGSFEEAIDAWRNYSLRAAIDNEGVILAATSGAINVRLGAIPSKPGGSAAFDTVSPQAMSAIGSSQASNEPEPAHLRSVVGLVWRTVVMWMVLLALLTLARLLG